MRFAQLDLWRRSIRFRLMAWNTGVVLVMALVALLAVREGLRLTLLSELDERLREDALEVRLAFEEFYPNLGLVKEELDRKAIGHAHQAMFIQILDQHGQIVAASINTPAQGLPRADGGSIVPLNWGDYRLVQQHFTKSGLPDFSVRVGSSLEPIWTDIGKLTRLILLVGLALLPLAAVGGFVLTDRALQPIKKIIHTARRLRPAQLDERLALRHTGDELDQLSLTINQLLDRIGDYLVRHREFIANAAHELRSPLAAIQSTVEVGLNSDRSVDEYKELLYETVEQCRTLSLLVNQLLLLAESDVARTLASRESVQLDQVVERCVEMFRAAAEERGIELSAACTPGIVVAGNALRLRQVVNNLIDNGLKFSAAGGRVAVQLTRDPSGQRALLQVADSGCGIAPAELPHIFERFYQVNRARDRDAQMRGNGLGLSICQAIVEAHGGTIEVTSAVDQGTTFVVSLPAEPISTSPRGATPSLAPAHA